MPGHSIYYYLLVLFLSNWQLLWFMENVRSFEGKAYTQYITIGFIVEFKVLCLYSDRVSVCMEGIEKSETRSVKR